MFRRPFFYFALALVVLGARLCVAQTTAANPDSSLQTVIRQIEGEPLTLQAATQLVLENATAVRTAEAAYLAAEGAMRREAGTFDPELFFSIDHFNQKQPSASFFAGAPVLNTVQTTTNGGLRMELPIGTQLEASLNAVRLKTNSSFAFLNPQYTTFGSLSLRQPLLGGFHISARKDLKKAEEDYDAAKTRYDQEVLAVTADVERSYWDLYAAVRDYAVQKLSRERASTFLDETQLRAKTGLIGPNQVASARTFLAEQTILLLDQEEAVDRLSDRLASLIGRRPSPEQPRYVPADHPPSDFPEKDADELVTKAKEKNLLLQALSADVEARRALAKAGFWEALPQLDVVASISGNGLSGTPQNVIFGGDTLRTMVTGSYWDAVSQAINRDFPAWSVGMELTIPIGLRKGPGEEERLEAEVTIAEQRKIQLERMLEDDVRASYRELEHGKRRLAAAREGVQAAEEQVRIGTIEFQNGRSTAFELVRLRADFAAAQQRYTQALVRSAKAAATLRELTSGAYQF